MKRSTAQKNKSLRLLLLVRHGKAAPRNTNLRDFERILTKKGIAECKQVASDLSKKKSKINLMLSSPADRALETAHIFANELKYPVQQIKLSDIIYSAENIQPFVTLIKQLGNDANIVALCGHNPSIDLLAAYFIPGFKQSIPKGAVVAIAFQLKSWKSISKESGRLFFKIAPDVR